MLSMLAKTILFSGALMLFALPSAADTPPVRSVDIYPRGARFVFGHLPTEDEFQFELPGAFIPESVRLLNPRGVTDLKVLGQARKGWVPPSLVSLRERIDAQGRSIDALNAQKTSLEQTRTMLNAIHPKEAEAKDLLSYIENAQNLRLRVENELAELAESLRTAHEELERLERELEERSPADADRFVRVSGRTTLREPLLFEAHTGAARWGLHYVMDLNSTTGAIDVRMIASAAQGTGLDYSGDVLFHSRRPADSVSPPALNPLRVALERKEDDRHRNFVLKDSQRAVNAPMMAAKEMEDAADLPEIESTLSNVTVRGRGTLEGDGSPADVALGELSLASTPVLVLIPEQRSEAWIVASMDSIPAPLMPGAAELMVDGRPSGRTRIPEYGLGQTRLPFGSVPRLTAKKVPLVESTGSSWLGGSGIFKGGYALEITSGLDAEREVSVRDRLPIPVDERIKLEVKKMDPEPTERDAENRLTWKLSLKPGETRRILVEYSLTYPSGQNLEYR